MDTITDLCEEMGVAKIEKFMVSGASKRGWTTWTTVNKKLYRFNFEFY
jgi:PhoPQ-activated pathogenicity-related protein